MVYCDGEIIDFFKKDFTLSVTKKFDVAQCLNGAQCKMSQHSSLPGLTQKIMNHYFVN